MVTAYYIRNTADATWISPAVLWGNYTLQQPSFLNLEQTARFKS